MKGVCLLDELLKDGKFNPLGKVLKLVQKSYSKLNKLSKHKQTIQPTDKNHTNISVS